MTPVIKAQRAGSSFLSLTGQNRGSSFLQIFSEAKCGLKLSRMFLLDTGAISELNSPRPNAAVVAGFSSVEWMDLRLSVMTVAELWQGITRLSRGRKRRSLEASFELIQDRSPRRILAV